jgi:hypothetical protein
LYIFCLSGICCGHFGIFFQFCTNKNLAALAYTILCLPMLALAKCTQKPTTLPNSSRRREFLPSPRLKTFVFSRKSSILLNNLQVLQVTGPVRNVPKVWGRHIPMGVNVMLTFLRFLPIFGEKYCVY